MNTGVEQTSDLNSQNTARTSPLRALFGASIVTIHDDVIKWKKISALLVLCKGNPTESPHKGQWRRALIISLICVLTTGLANNRAAGYLIRHCAHYDVTVKMFIELTTI